MKYLIHIAWTGLNLIFIFSRSSKIKNLSSVEDENVRKIKQARWVQQKSGIIAI
jgi:hypothetical protein